MRGNPCSSPLLVFTPPSCRLGCVPPSCQRCQGIDLCTPPALLLGLVSSIHLALQSSARPSNPPGYSHVFKGLLPTLRYFFPSSSHSWAWRCIHPSKCLHLLAGSLQGNPEEFWGERVSVILRGSPGLRNASLGDTPVEPQITLSGIIQLMTAAVKVCCCLVGALTDIRATLVPG